MRNHFKKLFFLSLGLLVAVLYNNCAAEHTAPVHQSTSSENNNNDNNGELGEQNFLKTPKPSLVCGKEGYDYLIKEHFQEHCASCHNSSSFADPKFVQGNLTDSYNEGRTISRSVFIETVTKNTFCGKDCNLDEEGEVYEVIVEWLDNQFCP